MPDPAQYPPPQQVLHLPKLAIAARVGSARWGNSAAQYRHKHVTVVEEDIDPADDEQVE